MSKDDRGVIGDWLILIGAAGLFASLFLPWSHQLSRVQVALFGPLNPLRGIPPDPTAWQVYSAADVVLALIAGGLFGVGLLGNRPVRLTALVIACVGLVFSLHALETPPTNGTANVFSSADGSPGYVPMPPGAGAGETVAIVGLLIALTGLGLSFTAD